MNTETTKITDKSVIVSKSGQHLAAKDVQPRKDITPLPEGGTMVDQLISMAIDKNLDMDKLERLMEMKDKEELKTSRQLFNAAMARVQLIIQPIIADADNDHTGSRYSKLCTIVGTLSPIYAAEGFSVSYGTADCGSEKLTADGWFRTTAELSHAGGFSKHYFVDLPSDIMGMTGKVNKTKIHGTKSTITYARGILMGLMFNFTTTLDIDVDGNQPGDVITEEQVAILRDHLSVFKDAAVCENDLCSFLKIKSLEDLPVKLLSKAQKAIAEQKKAEGIK